MKILIAYASVTGTTTECVRLLRHFLQRRRPTVVDLTQDTPDLSEYDTVIVGGPVRHAKLHPTVASFIANHAEALKEKRTAYFIVCGFADEAEEQIEKIFPKDLREAAFDVLSFGGTLDVSRQKSWKDKLYVRFMRNTITDTGDDDATEDGEFTRVLPTINPDTISRLASKLS
jgi:menaquinone-dependent protoporphyrinogen oxidase